MATTERFPEYRRCPSCGMEGIAKGRNVLKCPNDGCEEDLFDPLDPDAGLLP